jgi:uncharacterized membrane protein YbhN (UPF0104 family)
MSVLARCRTYAWKTALVLGVAAAGLWTAIHGIAGVSWADVAAVLRAVDLWHLGGLALIWLGGLAIYSLVLSAALPGLGVRRGLVLNLSGSAVANVVPLGGAVATALNWRMVRGWGHSDRAFIAFCILTNSLDIVTKLLLPVIAVATLTALSLHVPVLLWVASIGCAAVLCAALLVMAAVMRTRPNAAYSDSRWRTAVHSYGRDCGGRIQTLLVQHWLRLVPASVGYVAAQVALLFFALRSVGLVVPVASILTAAAIERLGTVIPLTPGGTGVAEVGAIAWLVATGLDPVSVVAGVLLYRVVLIAMDIPVGGVLLAGWAWTQRGVPGRRRSGVLA